MLFTLHDLISSTQFDSTLVFGAPARPTSILLKQDKRTPDFWLKRRRKNTPNIAVLQATRENRIPERVWNKTKKKKREILFSRLSIASLMKLNDECYCDVDCEWVSPGPSSSITWIFGFFVLLLAVRFVVICTLSLLQCPLSIWLFT